MYKKPDLMIVPVAPQNIICASGEFGGGTEGNVQSGSEGDAPKRREGVLF